MTCLQTAGIDFDSDEEDAVSRGDLLQVRPIGGKARGGGSTWQSLKRQTGSVKMDYLNGEIVLIGRQHGIPTPVNEILQQLATRMAAEHAAPGSVSPDDFLALLTG